MAGSIVGTDEQFVVDCLDHDLFRRVLADVEPQLDLLLASLVLDQGWVQSAQPVSVTAQTATYNRFISLTFNDFKN